MALDAEDYALGRKAWYDRNPVGIVLGGTLWNKAPHAATVWWTYTVPPGKKAFLELLVAKVIRQTAAGPAGVANARILIHITGVPTPDILNAVIFTNNVGDKDSAELGQSLTLNAGEWIKGETADTSTGGTCAYLLTLKATEFDL